MAAIVVRGGSGANPLMPGPRMAIGTTGNPGCSCPSDPHGDLDSVGNVEEHFRQVKGRPASCFSVFWFENPTP